MKYLALVVLSGCGRLAFDAAGLDAATDTLRPDAATTDAGLLLHFAFEPATFLDETATGHDGMCPTKCPTRTTGHTATSGGAAFDGTACVTAAYDIRPPVFTYALWENTATMATASLFGRAIDGATNSSNTFEAYTLSSTASLYLIAAQRTLEVQRPLGNWHHIAGVFDGTTLVTYLDGVAYNNTSSPQAAIWGADPFRIGCDMDNGVELAYYVGSLDDVRFYDRALSAGEVAQLATE